MVPKPTTIERSSIRSADSRPIGPAVGLGGAHVRPLP